MNLFAGKLLFEFRRVNPDGHVPDYRTVEEQIVHVRARGDKEALRKLRRYGKSYNPSWTSHDGGKVREMFLGIMDFQRMGEKLDELAGVTEVWWEMCVMHRPDQKKKRKMVFTDKELLTLSSRERLKGRRVRV